MPKRTLTIRPNKSSNEVLFKLDVLDADMPHPGWMRCEIDLQEKTGTKATVWYQVPSRANYIELLTAETTDEARKREQADRKEDTAQEFVDRMLVEATLTAVGRDFRGAPGVVASEIWRRVERATGATNIGQRLHEMGHAEFTGTFLASLVDAGLLTKAAVIDSPSGGPRYMLADGM